MLDKDGRKAAGRGRRGRLGRGADGARCKPAGATVTMKSKAFEPRVSVVGVGASVEFPNQDSIFHNVFSVSGDNRFDLELYKKPKSASKVFEHPGIVRIYCNIHPQMSGFVLVRDNPYWTKVAADGSYSDPERPGRHVGAEGLARALRRVRADGAGEGRGASRRPSRSTPPSTSARRTRTSSARTTRSARSTEGALLTMGLTGKILLFIAALVVLLVGGTLAFTTIQADRLARSTIDAGLKETRDVWQHDPDRPLQQAAARRARAGERPVLQGGDRRSATRTRRSTRSASEARTWPRTS